MKIRISIDISADRVVAELAGSDLRYDEPNLVALDGSKIVAIGNDAERLSVPIRVVPGYQLDPFEPYVTARVIEAVAKILWSRRRPQFMGLIAVFDAVEVRARLEEFDRIETSARAVLEGIIPYHHQMSWEISS